jgi:chromosome segregation ATPase
MTETDRKEESWIRKLPVFIVVLTVLIFIIIVIRDHNQYIKWEEDQTELTGKFKQTSEELVLLREAQGSLQEISEKVETLEQQAADLTTTLEKLVKEKNNNDSALSKQRQEMKNLNGQILTSKNQVAELTKERETINNTNQQLRDDILNKKNVLDSIEFLQRQKLTLEQNIQDLKKRHDLAEKEELVQQARIEDLQKKIKEGEAAIQAQNEQHAAMSSELSELTETLKKKSSQKEGLEIWDDHQRKLEYLEYLQQQKETLEITINNLLEMGKKLEEKNQGFSRMHQRAK